MPSALSGIITHNNAVSTLGKRGVGRLLKSLFGDEWLFLWI